MYKFLWQFNYKVPVQNWTMLPWPLLLQLSVIHSLLLFVQNEYKAVETSASWREGLQVVPDHFALADIITWDVAAEKNPECTILYTCT
jgi:hypothetical protein